MIDERSAIVEKTVIDAFTTSLRTHIQYVQEAGRKLGVNEWQLESHDASKWMDDEFYAYAQHFHGGGCPKKFAGAWLHHIHFNPHHWQHWIFPDGYSPEESQLENGVMEMPKPFALEMIADWMGAGRAYTGKWDMKDWLWKNMERITLHSSTADFVREVLDHQGYADVVFVRRFKQEIHDSESNPIPNLSPLSA